MKSRFDNVQKLLKGLREKFASFNEIEKTNSLLKKQLDSSLALTDQMVKKIGGLYQ
jgi:cell shape-determining protein MreC